MESVPIFRINPGDIILSVVKRESYYVETHSKKEKLHISPAYCTEDIRKELVECKVTKVVPGHRTKIVTDRGDYTDYRYLHLYRKRDSIKN